MDGFTLFMLGVVFSALVSFAWIGLCYYYDEKKRKMEQNKKEDGGKHNCHCTCGNAEKRGCNCTCGKSRDGKHVSRFPN